MKLLSERLEERATFEDARVLKEAKAMGFVPEVYSGSQTGALLREAASALRAVEGDAWQPIETAPCDGTYITVYQHGVLEPSQTICAWDQAWGNDGWWTCCDGKNPEIPLRGPKPTHWRPLPAAPLDAAGSAEGAS